MTHDAPTFPHSGNWTQDILCHLVVISVTTSDLKLDCTASLLGCSALLTPGDLENFKKSPFTLKEGVDYKIQVTFKVMKPAQHPGPDCRLDLQTIVTTIVLICRSTGRSCQAWNTSRTYLGKVSEVRRRLYFIRTQKKGERVSEVCSNWPNSWLCH